MNNNTKNYKKVFSEVYEIFKYMPYDVVEKIPDSLLKEIENCRDKDYIFEYNESKSLEEQNIFEETKDFISGVYINYCADGEEKKELLDNFLINKTQTKKDTSVFKFIRKDRAVFNNFNIDVDEIKEEALEEYNRTLPRENKQSFVEFVIERIKEIIHF